MNLLRVVCASTIATLVACAGSTPSAPAGGSKLASISGLSTCSGLPAGFGNPSFLAYGNDTGTVYVPTNLTAASEAWVVFGSSLPTYYGAQSASLHYSSDGWTTTHDVALPQWCVITNAEGDQVPLYGLSLGKLATGTTVALDIHQTPPTDYYLKDVWLNNGGNNYAFTVAAAQALSFVGASTLAVGGVVFDPAHVPLDQAITVSAQSYPAGAGSALTINWVDAGGHAGSAALAFASTGAGDAHDNDLWTAALPASVAAGAFTYYLSAVDSAGNTLRDVPAGSETKVSPIAYPVTWAGNLGTFFPYGGEPTYTVGEGFGSDQAFSIGCNNEGADLDSYSAHAVQVYIPGITDRTFATPQQAAMLAQTLTAEVYTNATKTGWGTIPAQFGEQLGHNFVYTFFNYNDLCPEGPPATPIADGTYQYLLQFSTDGGASFYKLGTSAGGTGGSDLTMTFADSGLY